MSFAKTIIGKELEELEYTDLVSYFQTEKSESDQLEFKSINPRGQLNDKFPGLIRSICAFLNSSGGLLIWGAPQGVARQGQREKVFSGDLTHLDNQLEKDFLISKVSDSIIPLPQDITVKVLSSENGYLAVFEILESSYSPHQTANTYYMRIDGQTKPAPHHYIEALFRRIRYPNIENLMKIIEARLTDDQQIQIQFETYYFNWSPLENEEDLSIRIVTDRGIFRNSSDLYGRENYRMNGHEYFREPLQKLFHYGAPISDRQVIKVQPEENPFVKIHVMFGGKKSPMKTSKYTIDLRKLNNHNDMIIDKSENRTMKDVQNELGVNKNSIVDDILRY